MCPKFLNIFVKFLYLGDDGDVLGVTLPGRGVLCVRVCRARGRGGGGEVWRHVRPALAVDGAVVGGGAGLQRVPGVRHVGVGELVQGGHQRQEGGQQQQQGEGGGAHGGASVSAGELRRSEESGPSPTFIQTPQHRGGETSDRVQAAVRLGDL